MRKLLCNFISFLALLATISGSPLFGCPTCNITHPQTRNSLKFPRRTELTRLVPQVAPEKTYGS